MRVLYFLFFYKNKIIPKLNEAIPNITDKVNEPFNAFKIDNIKDDELDFDSIEDSPREIATVYGDYKNRNTNTCPHCGHIFDEPPTRGRKCPECGNQFYVRSNNRLFASDLLKPQDAIAADCFSHMLDMPDFDITVEFARNMVNLEYLNLEYNEFTDISPLENLVNLKTLLLDCISNLSL